MTKLEKSLWAATFGAVIANNYKAMASYIDHCDALQKIDIVGAVDVADAVIVHFREFKERDDDYAHAGERLVDFGIQDYED